MHDTPKLVVGTIHSVKGGEADSVYLFPDLSRAVMREWVNTGEGHDGIIRQFYVAMTRTRENLVICASNSSNTVEFCLRCAACDKEWLPDLEKEPHSYWLCPDLCNSGLPAVMEYLHYEIAYYGDDPELGIAITETITTDI